MKIAVCFFGKARSIDKNYKNILETFEKNGDQVDYFISTWEEKNRNLATELSNYFKPKYLKVESENCAVLKKAFDLYGTFYPMMYKKYDVVSHVPEDYDLIVLTRLDLYYDEQFDSSSYNANVLYTGSGFFSYINEEEYYQQWKKKINRVSDYFDIYQGDRTTVTLPKVEYIEPVCDQFYISSPKVLKSYVNVLELLNFFLKEYESVGVGRKRFQRKIDSLFALFNKSKVMFSLYKILSIKYGFYIPFWTPLNKCAMAKLKPTLMSYQVAFHGIEKQDTHFKYRVRR